MANYLPIVLSPTMQDWLTELPANSINSWGDLCARFISNFQGAFTKPGVEWDLYQITKRKTSPSGNSSGGSSRRRTPSPASVTQSSWQPFEKGSRISTFSKRYQGS